MLDCRLLQVSRHALDGVEAAEDAVDLIGVEGGLVEHRALGGSQHLQALAGEILL